MNTIWIVLPILTLLMFDLGLSLRFEDFGKVFRQSSGMTPQAYRLGAVWRPPAVERPDPQKQ